MKTMPKNACDKNVMGKRQPKVHFNSTIDSRTARQQ